MSDSVSTELARFIINLKYNDLPEAVIEKAKEQILDSLGVALAASTLPWCKAVYDYVNELGSPGKATVVNYGLSTNPEFAAMANATFVHGFELDDYYPPAGAHPGCVAVPTALALTEHAGGGKELILGTVIGDEVILRVALAAATSFIRDRGVHITSAEGVFGAAAAASRLLRLSESETINALGLAASHASGVMEFAVSGGEVKRYHAGMGASGGIRSARLAQKGLTAPSTAIEGKRGALQALADTYDVAKLTEGLGKDFKITGIAVKTFASPAILHMPIEALAVMKQKYGFTGEDIESIEVGMHKSSLWHMGSVGPHPRTAAEAQFSVHFQLGMAVAKGSNSFAAMKEQMDLGFKEHDVLSVAEKVHLVADEESERLYPKVRQSRVTVRTKDGRVLTETAVGCKGMPERPLTRKELEEKFRSLASAVLPGPRVEAIINKVWTLDKVRSIDTLTHLLGVK